MRVTRGRQTPLYNIKIHCPNCDDSVIINRLFEYCIFCGHPFDIDWDNPFTKGMKCEQFVEWKVSS